MDSQAPKKATKQDDSTKVERPAVKKFPKISEIDPDEEPRKKSRQEEIIEAANLYSQQAEYLSLPPILERIAISAAELREVSSQIINRITLEKEQGIAKTNFIIQTKAFGEVEIQLTLYDTNPHNYHIRLAGSEKIMQLSIKHQNSLQSQIQSALPRIRVHIAAPVLRKKDRFEIKSKKSIEKRSGSCYGAVKRK